MKKIELYTGGHPLLVEDLQHLQAGVIESLTGLVNALYDVDNYPNYGIILSGCHISVGSGSTRNVSEGFVAFQGEVFHVPAHSFATPAFYRKNKTRLELIETYSGIQPVTYADSSSHNTRLIREMQFFYEDIGSSSSVTSDGIFYNIKEALATFNVDWLYIAADPSYYSVPNHVSIAGGTTIIESTGSPFRVKKEAGMVHLQGHFTTYNQDSANPPVTTDIFTLPLEMRPTQQLKYKNAYGDIVIDTNGKVTVFTNLNTSFYFDNVIFSI